MSDDTPDAIDAAVDSLCGAFRHTFDAYGLTVDERIEVVRRMGDAMQAAVSHEVE